MIHSLTFDLPNNPCLVLWASILEPTLPFALWGLYEGAQMKLTTRCVALEIKSWQYDWSSETKGRSVRCLLSLSPSPHYHAFGMIFSCGGPGKSHLIAPFLITCSSTALSSFSQHGHPLINIHVLFVFCSFLKSLSSVSSNRRRNIVIEQPCD